MSTKDNFLDRRIVKSKRAMRNAVLSLMQEKDFKEISISEIVRIAELNRGTFYKHYQYKEDILNEIIDEVISDLIKSFREPYKGRKTFEVNELTTSAIKIFDHVSNYATFYSLIVKSHTLAGFQHKFCSILKELAINDFHEEFQNTRIDRELHVSYQAYAILGLVIEWINGGFKYSSIYMAEQLLQMIKQNQSHSVLKPSLEKQ